MPCLPVLGVRCGVFGGAGMGLGVGGPRLRDFSKSTYSTCGFTFGPRSW